MTRKKKPRGGLWAFLFVWLGGAATAFAISYFAIPSVYIHATPDGSWERVEFDWENTAGKRILDAFGD